MNKQTQKLTLTVLALTSAATASGIMIWLSPKQSILAFVGWIIFFLAIQSPIFLSQSASNNCADWLTRVVGKKMNRK